MTTTPQSSARVHPHTEILRTIYTELTRMKDHISDEVVLHRAARTSQDPRPCVGKDAVMAHEHALLGAAGGTLVMEVQHIVAKDHFGAVLAVLRIRHPQKAAMPFCGLWLFKDGRIVESLGKRLRRTGHDSRPNTPNNT